MKTSVTFYKCEVCGNMVALMKRGGGQLLCCGKNMVELKANTVEAAVEKHIPVAVRKDGELNVQVGSVIHPMSVEHYIEWIAAVTDNRVEIVFLSPGEDPKAVFSDKGIVEVYEYCSLHGLWKSEVK